MGIFGSMLHGFLPFSPAYLTRSYSFWYGLKDLFTLHELADKVVLEPSKLITSQAVEGSWILSGGLRAVHGRMG